MSRLDDASDAMRLHVRDRLNALMGAAVDAPPVVRG